MGSGILGPNVAIGELLWDLLPEGPRLGGTTANYAMVSARLGGQSGTRLDAQTALISCVGRDDLGSRAIARLTGVADELANGGGFDLSAVQISDTLPTGTVSVTLDAFGRPRYVIDQPVAWDGIAWQPRLVGLAQQAGVVCFGTLAQRLPTSRQTIRAFVEATPAGCARVCDLNLRAPFCDAEVVAWCLRHATVIKVSDEELPEVARLLGNPAIAEGFPYDAKTSGEDSLTAVAVHAARELLRRAPKCELVAVTLGPHGSLVARTDAFHRHRGFKVNVVDTIGAGDAFTAGLVHAFVRGASLAGMNEVSNLCGSYVASQSGATPVLPETLLAAIRQTLG